MRNSFWAVSLLILLLFPSVALQGGRSAPASLNLGNVVAGQPTAVNLAITTSALAGEPGSTLNPAASATGDIYSEYSQQMANLERDHMLAPSGGYYAEASSDWSQVTNNGFTFPGNSFIARGFLQLYQRTGNSTYMTWAKSLANTLMDKAWDKVNHGFYATYDDTWSPTTCNQPLQENADFVHVSLYLYASTGNTTYYTWANQTMNFIMSKFHDSTYGGTYYEWDPCSQTVSDSNKYLELSLGAFAWAAMSWYQYSRNSTALKWSGEAISWMRDYLWNATYGGYMTSTDRTGTVNNYYYYPNVELWGMTGILEYYAQTGNSSVLSWAEDGLNHISSKMWDEQYGGWYRKLNGDNTVNEDTKTGWDNCEQPWLWYNAYQETGIPSYYYTSSLSAVWTSSHSWDPKKGGIFLEVNRTAAIQTYNTKDDWVQGDCMVAFSLQQQTQQGYTGYATETANDVAKYMYDTTNGGYYTVTNGNWAVTDNTKELTFKYWTLAWLWLYERTGNQTYYNYAVKYSDVLVDKAWQSGFYDSYTSAWSPTTTAQSSASNGISLWELATAYTVAGNSSYLSLASKTASWLIRNLWDSTNGCFWEDTTKIGVDKYVEGCADAIIGLMSLYQINGNQTFKSYIDTSISFIESAWDSVYGGFYARTNGVGSCAPITNGCNKYPNESTIPVIALAMYYGIWGSQTAKTYADRGIDYVSSTLWDSGVGYRGGLFRSLYQNDSIRTDTKTAWDNCGEPWMIWFASDQMGGNSTYQSLATQILNFCTTNLHDSEYGGFVTEVNRNGTMITDDIKDGESISDSIASFSLVTPVNLPPNVPSKPLTRTDSSTGAAVTGFLRRFDIDGGPTGVYGAQGGDDASNIVLTLKLVPLSGGNGFEVSRMTSGDQYEADFYVGTVNISLVFKATGISSGQFTVFYKSNSAPEWNTGDSLLLPSLATGIAYSDTRVGVVPTSSTASSDGSMEFVVQKSYLGTLLGGSGGTGSMLSGISVSTYAGGNGNPEVGKALPNDRSPGTGTSSYVLTSGDIPDLPVGVFVLALAFMSIYLWQRRSARISFGRRLRNSLT